MALAFGGNSGADRQHKSMRVFHFAFNHCVLVQRWAAPLEYFEDRGILYSRHLSDFSDQTENSGFGARKNSGVDGQSVAAYGIRDGGARGTLRISLHGRTLSYGVGAFA